MIVVVTNVPFLYPLKKTENQTFSGAFWVYKIGTLTTNGLRLFGTFPSFTQKLKIVANAVRKISTFCFTIFTGMSLLLVTLHVQNFFIFTAGKVSK